MTEDRIAYVLINDTEAKQEIPLEADDGIVTDENGETIFSDFE